MSFKLKHSGVPALMKTLTAGQKNMVNSMRKSGKTEAADKIQRGIEKAPIRKDPGDKKAKFTGKMRKDEQGRIVGTDTPQGGSQAITNKKNAQNMVAHRGNLFNADGSLKAGENRSMMENLIMNKNTGDVHGYTDPKTGKTVRFEKDQSFNIKDFKRGSRTASGRYTGTGIQNKLARSVAQRFYQHNSNVDNVNRAIDRNRQILAAEKAGEEVKYERKKEEPTRTVAAAPKKLGVKGLAKKAAPKKRGVKGLAKKAAPKKYGCKKKK